MDNVVTLLRQKRRKAAARKQRLTELTLKAKEKSKPYLIWDDKNHGLAICIQPTGSRSWKFIYSRHGRPRWLHLGKAGSGAIGLADARMMATEAYAKVQKGEDPAADKRAGGSESTKFTELQSRYVEQYAKLHNKSWVQADRLLRTYVIPKWKNLPAASITQDDVKAITSNLKSVLANQVLASISAVFSWAIDKKQLPSTFSNPARGVDRNKTKSRERVLQDHEMSQFWAAFDDLDQMHAAALKVLLLTGQRPGEVARMKWEHIKPAVGADMTIETCRWWHMPGEIVADIGWKGTKTDNSHRVWLSTPVRQILLELAGDEIPKTGFVFGRRAVRGLDADMRAICEKLGIVKPDKVTPHDLRRTNGTTITRMGFGRPAMNRIQNHNEGGIADVYDVYQYADENRRIMEDVAARIMALAGVASKSVKS